MNFPNTNMMYVDFIDDEIDVAIRITNEPALGLKGRKLIQIDHVLVATPEYLKRYGIPRKPQDLVDHQCIYLGEQASDSKWKFQKGSKTTSVVVKYIALCVTVGRPNRC